MNSKNTGVEKLKNSQYCWACGIFNKHLYYTFFLIFFYSIQAEHDRVMEKWTEKMSREGKMAGILAAQARVADLKEYWGLGSWDIFFQDSIMRADVFWSVPAVVWKSPICILLNKLYCTELIFLKYQMQVQVYLRFKNWW